MVGKSQGYVIGSDNALHASYAKTAEERLQVEGHGLRRALKLSPENGSKYGPKEVYLGPYGLAVDTATCGQKWKQWPYEYLRYNKTTEWADVALTRLRKGKEILFRFYGLDPPPKTQEVRRAKTRKTGGGTTLRRAHGDAAGSPKVQTTGLGSRSALLAQRGPNEVKGP